MKVAGLSLGQSLGISDLAAAADRLGGSGLFISVSYKYTTNGGLITVTFEVAEQDWTVPVVFDNFVWFSDDEVADAVTRDLPTFKGAAPAAEGIPPRIERSLTALLALRNRPGRVAYTPEGDLKGNLLRHVFSVTNPGPRICALRIDGAVALTQAQLTEPLRELMRNDYSRRLLSRVSEGTLTRIYRQRGHWRAKFDNPLTELATTSACEGVSVTLRVNEGPAYAFDHASWTGNSALLSTALDRSFGMSAGDVADVMRFEEGLRRVNTAYGAQGYVMETATYETRLDDGAKRVELAVTVTEGAQFRMGAIDVIGLTGRDADDVKKRWKLAPGEIFDATYSTRFWSDELQRARRGGPEPLAPAARLNPEQRTVDVQLQYK